MLAFVPDQVEETAQLKNIFDDDVDVSASVKNAVTLPKNESLVWDHLYQKGGPGYRINSGDRCDLELLRIYGNGRGARVHTRLTLFFTYDQFQEYEWTSSWTEPDLTVISARDILGVLQDKTLCWFRLVVTLLDGVDSVSIHQMDLFLEARDIEPGDYFLNKVIDIEGIGPVYAKKLTALGIQTVEQLLHLGRTPEGRADLAARSEISEKRILRWVNMADLFRINGVGEEYSDLLEVSGVDSIRQLATRDHSRLFQELAKTNQERNLVRNLPGETQVKEWIIQARNMDQLVVH